MTTAVLLAFSDGRKELIDNAHVHGYRDQHVLIATGDPGAGLDAEVVRTVPVAGLAFAETCAREDEADDDGGDDGPARARRWTEVFTRCSQDTPGLAG